LTFLEKVNVDVIALLAIQVFLRDGLPSADQHRLGGFNGKSPARSSTEMKQAARRSGLFA
jgi:hypothetical protein